MIDIKAIRQRADRYASIQAKCPTWPHEIIALCDEVERLTACLKKANDQAEHFERGWYLRGDEIDKLRTALEQPAVEPVAWMVRNGCVNYQLMGSKAQADALAAEMQKRHDLSGSLASFRVCPLYTAPQAQQPVVEQQLMRLLASAWFYGGWKAETKNEQDMETLMIAAGLWPFKDEAELLARIAAPQAQPAPVQEPVAWAHDRFIENEDGVQIGTDEPELQWGKYAPDDDGGWFPLYAAYKSQPNEKPVGEVAPYPDVVDWYSDEPPIGTKLYVEPQAQQPRKAVKLTGEEVAAIVKEAAKGGPLRRDGSTSERIARAIEQAVLEKNGVTE